MMHMLQYLITDHAGHVSWLTVIITEVSISGYIHCDAAAYLKSWWSWVDVLATLGGWTQLLPGDTTDVSGLRVLRALRPLRDLSSLPGLMLLVKSLVESIPLLRDVMLLLLWMLAIFAIIGMQLRQVSYFARLSYASYPTTHPSLFRPPCS